MTGIFEDISGIFEDIFCRAMSGYSITPTEQYLLRHADLTQAQEAKVPEKKTPEKKADYCDSHRETDYISGKCKFCGSSPPEAIAISYTPFNEK